MLEFPKRLFLNYNNYYNKIIFVVMKPMKRLRNNSRKKQEQSTKKPIPKNDQCEQRAQLKNASERNYNKDAQKKSMDA